ncbi:MAG: arsenite efflux transporter metallochaperone ArsD [Alkalibacterium sp.]|nr:arsenite efflux transporter metallochaperone ArsD [Alkalibacterium sp.]
MTKLEIFEPALCCSTGVCGPSVDDELMMITSIVNTLNTAEGYEAVRYNLSGDPQAFVSNENVTAILQEKEAEALPITLVNGEVKKTGAYPTLEEISDYMEVQFVMAGSSGENCCGGSANTGDCCGGSNSGCC